MHVSTTLADVDLQPHLTYDLSVIYNFAEAVLFAARSQLSFSSLEDTMEDPRITWRIDGTYLLACNCDYGCPCNFQAPPTEGWCEGVIGFTIDSGTYGAVPLDGRKVFVAVKWPGAIHEGGGKAVLYVDDEATEDQREALTKIMTGEAGGAPWAILANTYEIDGPHFVPIEARIDGKDTSVNIADQVRIRFQPIRNPVTGAEAFPQVRLPQGMIFKEGDQYSLQEFHVAAGTGVEFSHAERCASLAKVHWPTA